MVRGHEQITAPLFQDTRSIAVAKATTQGRLEYISEAGAVGSSNHHPVNPGEQRAPMTPRLSLSPLLAERHAARLKCEHVKITGQHFLGSRTHDQVSLGAIFALSA